MPSRLTPKQIATFDEETQTLRLCAPLSPSQNVLNGWISSRRFSAMKRFRTDTLSHLKLQSILALGTGYPRPWAQYAELSIVRCSDTNRRLDRGNIIGGAKTTIDALQVKFGGGRNWFEGAGIIAEDTDDHLIIVGAENRPRGKHEELDLGTWLFIKRVR